MQLEFAPHYDRTIELPITDPLLIRLTESVGNLAAGLIYEIDRYEAEKLIMRRKAVAIGALGVMPDLALNQDELAEAGL